MSAATLNCPMCGASAGTDSTRCAHCGARLATVACASCFGMMFVGQKFCSHCGARAARADDTAGEALSCPRCRSAMGGIVVGASQLQECPRCDGLWAGAASLKQICADRERQAAVLGMPSELPDQKGASLEMNIRYVPCPVCRKLMNRVNFARCSTVVVDVCKEHGTWFDRDELRRVIEFIRGGGLETARARELAEIEERRRRAAADRTANAWDSQRGSSSFPGDFREDGISAVASALRNLLSS